VTVSIQNYIADDSDDSEEESKSLLGDDRPVSGAFRSTD